MDYSEHKPRYDRDGYVVVREFLGPDDLDRLNSEIDRFLREVVPGLPASQVFRHEFPDGRRVVRQIHRMNVDPFFEDYRRDPRWVALAGALLGEPVTARPPMWLNKPAGADHPTPPHQDNIAFCLTPPSGTQIFLATEPVDLENGCLRYLPGSHRRGMRPHAFTGVRGFSLGITDFSAAEEAAEVVVELRAGDAVAHHPVTVHRALPNRSRSRSRAAFAMTFEGASARIDQAAMDRAEQVARDGLRTGR
ncbi:MAG: phytanoyl-CoA dioxygenase family protein [Mycobacteriales bacterium]